MKRLLAILPLLIVVVLIQLLTTWTGTQFYLTQMTMARVNLS
jgi:signal transduction histidine kinase